MKFLFVSYDGLIADIAWQVVKEGHEASSTSRTRRSAKSPTASCPRRRTGRKEVDWADVIVFDDVLGHGRRWREELRQAGKLVVGGTPYTDRLEDDRAFGQQELKAAGVAIIPQENFTSFDEAIEYVRGEPEPLRDQAQRRGAEHQAPAVRRRGGGRAATSIQVLEDYKRTWSDTIKEFQLQRRIMGVEVAVGAFFNGKRVRHADLRQLRAQEAVPRRHRPVDRRDGHRRCSGASRTGSSTPR